MPKKKLKKYFAIAVVLIMSIVFVIRFSTPALLKAYVQTGIGSCYKIPILCMEPTERIIEPDIDQEYAKGLVLYDFPAMNVYLPKGYSATHELIHKVSYKKRKPSNASAAYLIYEKPGFFIKLFPQVQKSGVKDDYEFFNRLMHANTRDIRDITDTFFVIMKSIFTPDLGNQNSARMAKFTLLDKYGFINYNLSTPDNYFDCNIFDKEGNFFKIYIKDKGGRLDLTKVFTIISRITASP